MKNINLSFTKNSSSEYSLFSFNSIVLISILFIFLANTYFSYNLSTFETQSIAEYNNFKQAYNNLAKEYKLYADKITNMKNRISSLNESVAESRLNLKKFKTLTTKFESKIRVYTNEDTFKMNAVKEAMKFAWDNYKKYAWGQDEVNPLAKNAKNWLGLGLTIIDSIDTLYIMGLMDEYNEAKEFISKLEFEVDKSSSVFEMNIRILGGLLSIYSLTNEKVFLDQAKKFGDILMNAWETNFLCPYPVINLKTKQKSQLTWAGGSSPLADVGSLTMEFCSLSYYTGIPDYCNRVTNITEGLRKISNNGLVTSYVSIQGGGVTSVPSKFTMGGLGDSYYEYLLKMWILTQKKVPKFREMYDASVKGAKDSLLAKTKTRLFLKDSWSNSMEHLTCFAGGMFALGSVTSEIDSPDELNIGAQLTKTCRDMYDGTKSKIGPESISFDGEGNFYPAIRFYVLRPETVESFFYLWRLTKEQKYRDWAWDAFMAINTSCRCDTGFYGLNDIDNPSSPRDPQESFFMAETLKYLYLSFTSHQVISLDKWVFNTEAHPIAVWENDPEKWGHLFQEFDPRINKNSKSK